METGSDPDLTERTAPVWSVELAVAGALALVGLVVMADSWRVGTGWGAEGPQAGFFPFYIGLILFASAGWTFAANLRVSSRDQDNFVEWSGLRRVLAVLAPAVVFVALVPWLGIYLASALLIAFFMCAFGEFRLVTALATSIAISLVLFTVFELWFLTPMPKGPLEAMLGF
jgi:hypothetical protein